MAKIVSSKAYPRNIHDAFIRRPMLSKYNSHYTVTTSHELKLCVIAE